MLPNPPLVLNNNDKVECDISLADIQRIYIRFLTQLRAGYLLSTKIISIISSNIVALLEEIHEFAQQRSVPLSRQSSMTGTTRFDEPVIEFKMLIVGNGEYFFYDRSYNTANMNL